MSTGDGVSHNTDIVIEQGGAVEDIQSSGKLDVQAGATETVEGTETVSGTLNIGSGGVLNVQAGGALQIAGTDVTQEIANMAAPLTDLQQIVGVNNIILQTAGTWTKTRIAQGDYSLRHTAAADNSILGIDITQELRTAAGKGLKLASIDVIHKIGTLALNAHTATLQNVAYANNVANAITAVPLTGSLNTATQSNPYVDNLAVTTPAFNNTADSKFVFELTVNAQATSAYDFYGLCLHFTKAAP